MTKKKIRFRRFLYHGTIFILIWGVFCTGVKVKSEYTLNRNRDLIRKAKTIKLSDDSNETLQSVLRSFFGNTGEWTVRGKQIHVFIERGFSSELADTMEFDISLSYDNSDDTTDEEVWTIENVVIDGEKIAKEDIGSLMRMLVDSTY